MDNKKLIISPSPHIYSGADTQTLMRDVLVALLPAFVVSALVYGQSVIAVTAVSVAVCVATEWLIQRYLIKGPSTVGNLSAVVTGVLLAFNLPSDIPLWMVFVGAVAAIGVGKMSFGGLGRNPFNPALVGRVFMLISFPAAMTTFPDPLLPAGFDAVTGATPLSALKEGLMSGAPLSEIVGQFSYRDLLLGIRSGSFGELSGLALLLGFAYLLIRRVITWRIPVYVLGSMALMAALLWGVDPSRYADPLFHLLTGGAILGAVFMATDYATSPMNHRAMAIYAIGIGLLTMIIRTWGSYPEGMSFAILIMNAFVPLLGKYVKPSRFTRAANDKSSR
ncbi:electron transport complex subunit D [Bacteroidia bacterium]|nr:electron transport complex subunit D [Bacteroidia bacterium]